jgi:hypothetical protein
MKKYFIRKTPEDILLEQNVLIEKLLSQHKAAMQKTEVVKVTPASYEELESIKETAPVEDGFDFEDDSLYIPAAPKSSSKLNVTSTKVNLDMENVDRLKKKKVSQRSKTV